VQVEPARAAQGGVDGVRYSPGNKVLIKRHI